MRLVIKQNGRNVNEFRFTSGPVYIGRRVKSQVFLPDRAVSRQHAVIFTTRDGKWILEDLDSANKTYLNDKAIKKAEIKTGDCIRISGFTIEINLEEVADTDKRIHLEDTLITASREPQIIVRKPDVEHAPDIKLPAKRAEDFIRATETICKARGHDEVLQALLITILKQFNAYRAWCALRNQPTGPMTSHAGKKQDGKAITLNDIKLSEKITQAVENGQFLLFPHVAEQTEEEKIRSAMIAPVMDPTGCFGVLYVDNTTEQQQYSLSDLDYLMLLAIHTAAVVENF